MNCLKSLKTRTDILEHYCEWNLSLLWLLLAVVAHQWVRLGMFLAHQFIALETFTACYCVACSWTIRSNIGTEWACWRRKNVACQEWQHSHCIKIVLFLEDIWKRKRLLDSWVKRDQLDVTCFIISLFNAQHVSDINTSILRSLRLICWVISWVVLLWFDVCWCYVVVCLGWCGIRMRAEACIRIPHHHSQTTT